MSDNKDKKKDNSEAERSDKSIIKYIILGVMVILLSAGGWFGWRMFFNKEKNGMGNEEQAVQAALKSEQESLKIICPLESFIVNLMDKKGLGGRYLKTTIELEVDDEVSRDTVNKYETQLRDTILLLLTSQSFEEIRTVEGKLDLKQALLNRINQVLGERIVRRIYLTEFVVQ